MPPSLEFLVQGNNVRMPKRRSHGEFALRQARNGLLDLQGDLLTSTLVPRRIDGAETAPAKKATDAGPQTSEKGTAGDEGAAHRETKGKTKPHAAQGGRAGAKNAWSKTLANTLYVKIRSKNNT